MNEITRRRFLQFIGGVAGAVAFSSLFKSREVMFVPAAKAGISENLTPVRLPYPLPIYTEKNSWLATNIGGVGVIKTPNNPVNLTEYTVIDEVVIPPEYEYYVIVSWGDRPFSDPNQYVGYNHDYTAFVPLKGSIHDGCLYINHEYISYPFSKLAPDTPEDIASPESMFESFPPVVGFALPTTKDRQLIGEMLYNCGGTVVRVRHTGFHGHGARYQVVAGDAKNRRIHGLSGLAINADRPATDPYRTVTSWGPRPHQQGDSN
jgi:secreted PhoX family phosphatase